MKYGKPASYSFWDPTLQTNRLIVQARTYCQRIAEGTDEERVQALVDLSEVGVEDTWIVKYVPTGLKFASYDEFKVHECCSDFMRRTHIYELNLARASEEDLNLLATVLASRENPFISPEVMRELDAISADQSAGDE